MNTDLISQNLEYYKIFYYTAKYGSVTAAARKLCLTQPTLTSTIHKLEESLGTSLFVRSKKGVVLTNEGQILWNRIEPAMQLILSGETELNQALNLAGGSIRIVSTEMSYRNYIIPTLKAFTKDYPRVKIRFRNALTENVLEMVRNGETDIAILHAPLPDSKDLELKHLNTIEECFVVGPRYKYLSENTHDIADIKDVPLIAMPEGASTNKFISSLFAEHNISFEPDIEVTTIELVIQAVENDLGIATLPVSEAIPRIEAGTMFRVPLNCPSLERKAYVITSKIFPLSSASKVYLEDYLFSYH